VLQQTGAREALIMRTMIGTLAMVGMLVLGAGLARAQDDASMQAMQIAQQDNAMAMQAAQQAAQTANDMAQQAMQTMQQMQQQAMDNSMAVAAPQPALPVTPRPVISKLKGGVSVALQDADPKAIVFYTTDGSLPTVQSLRYAGPIVVSSKVKVRAMAFDLEDMPSGVVSKTIRVKS
jgi:Chitobiase/beta-hexosaminidase C-terminal domain